MEIKFIDLFAGIGGFRYGLEKAGEQVSGVQERSQEVGNSGNELLRTVGSNGYSGQPSQKYTCIWSNEWDKYANSIYKRHYGECDSRDIRTVDTKEIPDFDLLVGGFPCQAFSIAGKRRGFDDTRGTLFFEIARILKERKPRLCLLENVKGLLSHDNGNTFKTIISTLTELGYDCEWQVLNSKNFGVPQNRERVFIIGYLGGAGGRQIFPITGSNPEADGKITSTAIDTNYWKGVDNHGQRTMIELTQNVSDAQRIYSSSGIAKTLKGLGGGLGAKTGLYAMQWRRTAKGREARRVSQKLGRDYTPFGDGHRELVPKEGKLIGAITAHAVAKDSLIGNTMKIRRLTPIECERLQGFPDGWTESGIEGKISDTQRYKCLGNAVTTNVVTVIGERLLLTLSV